MSQKSGRLFLWDRASFSQVTGNTGIRMVSWAHVCVDILLVNDKHLHLRLSIASI
jgi:hypothetical protein